MLTESKIKEIIRDNINESSSKLLSIIKANVPNLSITTDEIEEMIHEQRYSCLVK